ncbi:MAG: hypothetical protein M3P40_10010 [Actinomycetota bacterium]|nr:hypothetical protein [Actinomycetota bacterium]
MIDTEHYPPDPRLAEVLGDDGAVDRNKIAILLARDPRTFTLAEIDAMYVVFFEHQDLGHGLTYTSEWARAFTRVIGGTYTQERVRRSETGTRITKRTVEKFRGRRDVRQRRALLLPHAGCATRRPAARAREHRPGNTRRASSSSRTSSADPGDDGEPASEPPKTARRYRAVLALHWALLTLNGVGVGR